MRTPHPGAWYVDATPDRAWAVLIPSVEIRTSRGVVPLPPGGNLLYLRCKVVKNVLCLVGQGHVDGRAWLWAGGWFDLGSSHGSSPCAFGPEGDVYVSRPVAIDNVWVIDAITRHLVRSFSQPLGARGIAHVDDAGGVHSVDEWYGRDGFAEYTDLGGGLWIGQGAEDGVVVRRGVKAPLRYLERGSCKFIHSAIDPVTRIVAVATWKDVDRGGVIHLFAESEIDDLPLVVPTVVVPPVVPPVPPVEPNPMNLANHLDTLRELRAAYPPKIDNVQAVEILNRLAWTHRDEGFGLLKKPDGNHGPQPGTKIDCSCDWITNRNGLGTDVFKNGPDANTNPVTLGEAGVQWGAGEPIDLARFVAPVDPGTGVPEVPPLPDTHKYIGGGNDTNWCDVEGCGRDRWDPVHVTAKSRRPHAYDPGEQTEGLCDECQKERDDPFHDVTTVPPVDPAVPPGNWEAAFRKLEAEYAAILRTVAGHDTQIAAMASTLRTHDASITDNAAALEHLTNRLGSGQGPIPSTVRVTGITLTLEP